MSKTKRDYVVYPQSIGVSGLRQAKELARSASADPSQVGWERKTRVEEVSTGRVVARYHDGRQTA